MGSSGRHAHGGATDRSGVLGGMSFVAEIALFATVGVAAFRLAGEGPGGTVLAVSAVVAVVIVWAVLMAAGASHRLPTIGRLALVVALGGAAAAALAATGAWAWAAVAALASAILVAATGRGDAEPPAEHVSRHARPR